MGWKERAADALHDALVHGTNARELLADDSSFDTGDFIVECSNAISCLGEAVGIAAAGVL